MSAVQFRVECKPKPLARPRGRALMTKKGPMVQMYNPQTAAYKEFIAEVKRVAEVVMEGRQVFVGPLRVDVLLLMPRPVADFRKTMANPRRPHSIRPDRDNIEKALSDALTGICWKDDAQICDGRTTKLVATPFEAPGVCVRIEPFSDSALSLFEGVEVNAVKIPW